MTATTPLRLGMVLKVADAAEPTVVTPPVSAPVVVAVTTASTTSGQVLADATTITENGVTYYIVKKGESAGRIATQFGLTLNQLMQLNGLANDATVVVGQKLRISVNTPTPTTTTVTKPATTATPSTVIIPATPVSAAPAPQPQRYTVQKGDTLFGIAKKHNLTILQLIELNGLQDDATVAAGQILVVGEQPAVQVPGKPLETKVYTVQKGETAAQIATRFGVGLETLLAMNGLSNSATLYAGQVLKISEELPSSALEVNPELINFYIVQKGETLAEIAEDNDLTLSELLKINGLSESATAFAGQKLRIKPEKQDNSTQIEYILYTVKEGDWLADIAARFRVTVPEIQAANALNNVLINTGQQLLIPKTDNIPPIPPALRLKADRIKIARQIFEIETKNGRKILGLGLRGSVGRNGTNYLEDVLKVQTRLIDLKLLAETHTETQDRLSKVAVNGCVTAQSIPLTVAAIEKFQANFVNRWTQSPTSLALLEVTKFTPSLVENGDATYKIMREMTHFTITVPHPIDDERELTAQFRNFVASVHTVYPYGISYTGGSKLADMPDEVFNEIGLEPHIVKTLKLISKHEGNLDALNTYDKAFFSFGFIQFAGSSVKGAFPDLVAAMKYYEPTAFKEIFEPIGIDVDFQVRNNRPQNAVVKFFDLYSRTGKFELSGVEAEKAMRDDPEALAAFIMAGYHPKLAAIQVRQAVLGYLQPAMGIRININLGMFQVERLLLTDIIRSHMGRAVIIDLTVNQWITNVANLFSEAIHRIATDKNITTLEELVQLDETEIIQSIIDNTIGISSKAHLAKRSEGMLKSDLSAEKPPLTAADFIASTNGNVTSKTT
jgi:peptidoglycan endopeptidase LytF